jgi:hypothetical protein
MPTLPDKYDLRQASPQPARSIVGGVPPIEQEAAENVGRAVSRLGMTGMALRQEQQEKEDRLNDAKARSQFLKNRVDIESAFDQDQDYKTFEPRYTEAISKAQGEAASLIRNPERREAFMAETALDRAQGTARIKQKAFAKEGDFERGQLDGVISSNRELALRASDEKTKTAFIANTQERIQSLIDAGHLDADQGKSLQRKSAEDYATASIEMLSAGEQVNRLKPGQKGMVDLIPSDRRADMLRRAEQQLKQEQALNRAALSDRVQDASAAYLSGLKYEDPPTRAEFIGAYGQKEGEQRYNSFVKTQKLGADISYAAMATPQELATMLADRDPRKAVVGAGFAEDAQRFGALVNSVNAMQKEKQADPVTYLQKYDPKFKSLWESLGQTGDYAGYARTMTAEQERLGVQDVKLLPDRYAQTIVSEFNKTAEGGENSADMIEQLAGQWGKNWPTVYKQLSKDLPPSALVIGSGVDRPTAERLARLAPLKTEDLQKGLDKADISSVKKSLSTEFAGFQQTLLQQAGGERTFSTIYDQAERLALSYVAGGTSPTDAVAKAYQSLVDDKYVIKDTYRVPVKYDADAIEESASRLLEPKLNKDQIRDRNAPYSKGGGTGDYLTELSTAEEQQFQKWVKENDVPFDPSPKADYDMRGFWKGLQSGDPHATSGINANDNKIHFSDYWKTPYHESFSSESQYAVKGSAPSWNENDQLVMPDGRVVFDERMPRIDIGNIDVATPAGLSKGFISDFIGKALARDAYWVTSPDETGLVLYHNGAALTKGGKPITVSFDELAGMQ